MSPTSSIFLLAETREHPMHVGGLQLFRPPEGADVLDVRAMFDAAVATGEAAPLFRKRARRSLTSLGQWGWERDATFDLEYHVRRSALPQPGRVRELLALCSRLHSTLLDRHRPLWELHLIEGLDDGRFALYFKAHHALIDGVSALRMTSRMLSADPTERNMPAPWAVRARARAASHEGDRGPLSLPLSAVRAAVSGAGDAAGVLPHLAGAVRRAMRDQAASLSLSAPRTMLNVPITGARRFAAQSWPIERIRAIAHAGGASVNDVVLALCSGALRAYLANLGELPDSPLIAMVPVSLHARSRAEHPGDGGGNSVGAVMCNLGTQLDDPAKRLACIRDSMADGKQWLSGLTNLQILALSAVGISPLLLEILGLHGVSSPPFNLVISNVPGPREPRYWNGARLDGLYPLSIPLNGQALNITCTSYADAIAFGLTGCRRTLPSMQRLLTHLDEELVALERAVAV